MTFQINKATKRQAELHRLSQAKELLIAHGYKEIKNGQWGRPITGRLRSKKAKQ